MDMLVDVFGAEIDTADKARHHLKGYELQQPPWRYLKRLKSTCLRHRRLQEAVYFIFSPFSPICSLAGRLDLPFLRHLPQRVQHRALPADARRGYGPQGQAGHDGYRLGGTHEVRRDLCHILQVRVATGAVACVCHDAAYTTDDAGLARGAVPRLGWLV